MGFSLSYIVMPSILMKSNLLQIDWSDGLSFNSRKNFMHFMKLKNVFICPLSQVVISDSMLLRCHNGQLFCYDRNSVEAYIEKKKNVHLNKLYDCITATIKNARIFEHSSDLIDFSREITQLQESKKNGIVCCTLNIFDPNNESIVLAEIKVKAIFAITHHASTIHLLKLVMQYELLSSSEYQNIKIIQKKMQDLSDEFEHSKIRYSTEFFNKKKSNVHQKSETARAIRFGF